MAVLELINSLSNDIALLEGHAATYARLRQLIQAASPQEKNIEAQRWPIITMTINVSGQAVPMEVDLEDIPLQSRVTMMTPLANFHAQNLLAKAKVVAAQANQLVTELSGGGSPQP